MMNRGWTLSAVFLSLVLLALCSPALGSSSDRERRHVGTEESSHRPDNGTRTPGSRSLKSSTSKNNEITAEPGRKVSHRLIGGHLRIDGKQEDRGGPFWDDGILMSAAGNGKEGKVSRGEDDDEKKTLSQQVKEGKYGLIQNEIYGQRPKRPGIISYLGNPEVPKDTSENLGGLDEEEIWLAENHVLVLRGGRFPGHDATQRPGEESGTWPPIDDYKAPRRQVKIPAKPKVPPPFPVQLAEGGPVQIIGANGTKEIANDTAEYDGKDSVFAKGLLPGDGPLFTIISNGTILRQDLEANVTVGREPSGNQDSKKRTERPPTFYHAIPPGAVFVPPPANQTDYEDEDQSIYYPPPYSFQYQQDNTTVVPPGPLVPGIILPPPPDFFAALDEKKSTTKKYTKRPGTTPAPRSRPTYLPPRKLTTKQYKTSTASSVETRPRMPTSVGSKMFTRTAYRNVTGTSLPTTGRTVPYVEITTPTPVRSTTRDNTEYYSVKPAFANRASEASVREKSRTWPELVTSKTVPVAAYYAATTPSSMEKPVEVTPASIKSIVTTGSPGRSTNHASYYFYEEPNSENTATTSNPATLHQRTITESSYKVESPIRPRVPDKQYYSVETVPSQQTSKDFTIKILDTVVKNSQPMEYRHPGAAQTASSVDNTAIRSQGQRMLSDHQPVYHQPPIAARPPVPSYYTTPRPQTYYREIVQPKPVYQYSFEAADYSKRGSSQRNQYRQGQSVSYEYQDAKSRQHPYEYEDTVPEQRLRPNSVPYKSQPYYHSTTGRPIVSTTQSSQHAYFTQQDEKLLDDVTKEYFTIFGKKISGKGISSTTPLYGKVNSVTEKPDYSGGGYIPDSYNRPASPVYNTPNVRVHYGDQSQRPYSLKDDTLVNYKQPLPPINPDSEFITVLGPKQQQGPLQRYTIQGKDYRLENEGNRRLAPIQDYTSQQIVEQGNGSPSYVPIVGSPEELDETYPDRPLSLADDIEVNYRDPRPTINPDAEFIDPIPVQGRRTENTKAYFAYRLPGDGGHFYFLTPQAVTQRTELNDGYLYPKSRGARLLRRRRRPESV